GVDVKDIGWQSSTACTPPPSTETCIQKGDYLAGPVVGPPLPDGGGTPFFQGGGFLRPPSKGTHTSGLVGGIPRGLLRQNRGPPDTCHHHVYGQCSVVAIRRRTRGFPFVSRPTGTKGFSI